ncbi:hypothetical protein CRG98_021695 [Punica granatum]|uniref:Uncharacterized protein n=1 Tax=Punica granatum TaxID=22663 RepID=A0A2I0JNN1_PUNGR|nr:hypothetical protein CRG98_021695 [Punica granatum]
MELSTLALVLSVVSGLLGALFWGMSRVNCFVYERKLGEKRLWLPPGDLGWPFIGNMWTFLRAFKSGDPDSFMSTFISRGSLCLLDHIAVKPLLCRPARTTLWTAIGQESLSLGLARRSNGVVAGQRQRKRWPESVLCFLLSLSKKHE